MAKPDDRSDNVEKLQDMVQDTIQNLEESEEYLDEHAEEIAPKEQETLERKNANRRESIQGFRSEIKDEAHDRGQS